MPVLDMCLYIWNDVQRKVFERSQTSAVATGAFSSYINNQYQHDNASSCIYIATPSSQSLGLVTSQQDPWQEFQVQLGLNGLGTCTCGLFQDNLRPCAHAIAFIHQVYGAPLDYIAKFHTRAVSRNHIDHHLNSSKSRQHPNNINYARSHLNPHYSDNAPN
jgi:hypothetical protein